VLSVFPFEWFAAHNLGLLTLLKLGRLIRAAKVSRHLPCMLSAAGGS
jgi:hypothetical protein